MAFDLSNHMPYGREEGFEEKGYTFKAWQPANDQAKRVIVIQAFKGEELVEEVESPMSYSNLFGVDIEDVYTSEKAGDDLVNRLPEVVE